MYVQATVNCECGCIFEVEYQGSSYENSPICPDCLKKMDAASWKTLRDAMGYLNDFNQHIVKWSTEHGEPRMQAPALTVRSLKP